MSENPYDNPEGVSPEGGSANNGCSPVLVCVAVAATGFLVLLCLPAFNRGSEPAYRTRCKNNLKQLMLAMWDYHDVHGNFPPAYTTDESGKRLHSWRTLLLPYLEQQALYDTIDLNKSWNHPNNASARNADSVAELFECPTSDLEPGFTYMGLIGPNAFFPDDGTTRRYRDLTGGTSNVFAITEVSPTDATHWMDPNGPHAVRFLLSLSKTTPTVHTGGVQVALGDGSVRFISSTGGFSKEMMENCMTIYDDDDVKRSGERSGSSEENMTD